MPDPEGKKATIEVAEKYERVTGRAVGVGKSVEILICSTVLPVGYPTRRFRRTQLESCRLGDFFAASLARRRARSLAIFSSLARACFSCSIKALAPSRACCPFLNAASARARTSSESMHISVEALVATCSSSGCRAANRLHLILEAPYPIASAPVYGVRLRLASHAARAADLPPKAAGSAAPTLQSRRARRRHVRCNKEPGFQLPRQPAIAKLLESSALTPWRS